MDDIVQILKKDKKRVGNDYHTKAKSSEQAKRFFMNPIKNRVQDINNDMTKQKSSSNNQRLTKGPKRSLLSSPKSSQTVEKGVYCKQGIEEPTTLSNTRNAKIGLNATEDIEKLKRKRLGSWCTKSENCKGQLYKKTIF